MAIVEEIGDYPKDNIIIYKQKNEKGIVSRSFTYKVITVGKYPDKKILQHQATILSLMITKYKQAGVVEKRRR